MKRISFKMFYQGFLHIALVALCFEVVYLANQNSKLKARIDAVGRMQEIKGGDRFTWSGLRALANQKQVDSVSSSVVFVFTTSCPYCKQNVRSWKEIALVADGEDLQVFGLALDSTMRTEAYARDSMLTYPILVPEDLKNFYGSSRILTVPKTILLSSEGVIEKMWNGLLNEKHMEEIKQTIHHKRTSGA